MPPLTSVLPPRPAVVYHNPVVASDAPDPGVVRRGDDFFMATTGGDPAHGAFPLRQSSDLVHWKEAGQVFAPGQTPAWSEGDFWAPEIHPVGDHYVAYFTARDTEGMLRIGAATSATVEGPYHDIGAPLVSRPDVGLIDPTFFRDDDGAQYLYWKEDGNAFDPPRPTRILAQRLDDDGLSLRGEAVEVLRNDADSWEGDIVEAPEVVKHGDTYYLMYSGNGYWGDAYAEGAARSKSPLGPFEKNPDGPFVASNDAWEGPGHAAITSDAQGRDWLVYHAWDQQHQGRQVLLDEIHWGQDGWPHVDGPSTEALAP